MVKKVFIGRITLRDVVVHMGHMGQRLTTEMKNMEQRLTKKIDDVDAKLSRRIDSLDAGLNSRMDILEERIDALDVDLTATIKDTIVIRRHVGMPYPKDDD